MAKLNTKKTEHHNSFGIIGWGRVKSSGTELFGSELSHSDLIRFTVMQASRKRDLSKTWVHGEETLVELYMSSHQFSELITSPNQGDGVLCTLRHTHKERNIDYPGHEPEAKMHRDEFKDRVNAIGHKSDGIVAKFDEMGKGKTIKKSDFHELKDMVKMMLQDYHSNLLFVEESFKESMDKTVSEGKMAVEAYISGRIRAAGLKSLAGEEPKLVEFNEDGYE